MNVFILCTGRCGSTTFVRACNHIRNYTALHESRTGRLGNQRFAYPDNHIEADNRLTWLPGRLDEAYGKNAFYVHLQRNEHDTAVSFAKRVGRGIMRAYGSNGILLALPEDTDPMSVAIDYCRTVTSNIRSFLADKLLQMSIRLERARSEFPDFCERISADVDLRVALSEFDTKYNASKP